MTTKEAGGRQVVAFYLSVIESNNLGEFIVKNVNSGCTVVVVFF